MSTPIIVETRLEDILAKIDSRLERIETKLEALPRIESEVSQLKEDVKDLKGRATAQIWTLIGLISSVITAIVAAAVKLGFFSNP
jgi:prefoldin subunit 5